MRKVFIETLMELARIDPRIVLLTGDLGYTVLESFQQTFPDRFINVGVAEQNMVGIAVGMAEAGFLPFVYSIASFAVLRPYEFIRNGAVHQKHPVRIVGIGGGFSYGTAGPSHHLLEDYAIMRTQPNMITLVPADSPQTATMLRATYNLPGPIYYRIDKNENIVIPELEGHFDLSRVELLREGKQILLLSVGSISAVSLAAALELDLRQITTTVGIVSCLNPAPVKALCDLVARHRLVITLEDHYVTGGLGSLIAETIADHGYASKLIRIGVKKPTDGIVGSEDFLREHHGLTVDAVVTSAVEALSSTNP